MLNSLKPRQREYKGAKLLIEADGSTIEKFFSFSIVYDMEKQFNTPIKNLMSSNNSFVIQTTWQLPFEANRVVVIQNGERWRIRRCEKLTSAVNEQSLGFLKESNSVLWVLELVQ